MGKTTINVSTSYPVINKRDVKLIMRQKLININDNNQHVPALAKSPPTHHGANRLNIKRHLGYTGKAMFRAAAAPPLHLSADPRTRYTRHTGMVRLDVKLYESKKVLGGFVPRKHCKRL